MGVYINMEMPQKTYAHCMLIKDIDGSVQLLVCTKDSVEISEWESYDLVHVPPHGDLIDRDATMNEILEQRGEDTACWFAGIVNDMTAIIPSDKAEEGET